MRKKNKLVQGVGTNDADYPVRAYASGEVRRRIVWRCPIYDTWTHMLRRCYNAETHRQRPTYVGCSVDQAWLTFSVFKAWMEAQDYRGNQLDKDILNPDNRVYSAETCVFVPAGLNAFLVDNEASRGDWPVGVHLDKRSNKLQARCNNPFTGEKEHLGRFSTPEQAHEAWRARKHQHACTYADQQTDPRIAQALRIRYEPQEAAQ